MALIHVQSGFAADSAKTGARYEAVLLGLKVGDIGVEGRADETRYNVTGDIASAGVLSVFSKHSSHTIASGNADATDIDYDTHYRTKEKSRSVKLIYKKGEITQEQLVPPDTKRPSVSAEMKKNSVDPLSFIMLLHRQILQAQKTGATRIADKIYDGRRLTGVDITIDGKRTITLGNEQVPVTVVEMKRSLLAGFTDEETRSYSPKEQPLFAYFREGSPWPVKLSLTIGIATLTVNEVKECGTTESCLLGITE